MVNPDNTIKFNTKSGDSFTSESTRRSPSSSQAFKKLLDDGQAGEDNARKKVKDRDSLDEEVIVDEEVRQAPLSPFDLARSQSKPIKKPLEGKLTPEQMLAQAQLNEGQIDGSNHKISRPQSDTETVDFPSLNLEGVDSKNLSKKGKIDGEFSPEQQDLTYINPMALQPQAIDSVQADLPGIQRASPVIRPQILDMLEKLVSRVDIMKAEGRTDTSLTLTNGIFNGARLTVTEFNTAQGSFNLTFENLTPDAQRLIAMQDNQAALRLALEQRGNYSVHIIVASTEIETPRLVSSEPQRQQQGRGDSNPRQRQQEEQDA